MSKKMPLATYYFTIYNECSSITLFYVSNSVDIMLILWYKPPSLLVPIYIYVLPIFWSEKIIFNSLDSNNTNCLIYVIYFHITMIIFLNNTSTTQLWTRKDPVNILWFYTRHGTIFLNHFSISDYISILHF